MDQRIESFLTNVLVLAGKEPDAVDEGVRVALAKCAAGAEEAHEGPSGARLPRPVPRPRGRRAAAPPGNADRGALEARGRRYRPAGALSHVRPPLPAALICIKACRRNRPGSRTA